MKRSWLVVALLVALVLAGATAWFVQRPTSYDDRDWSALPASAQPVEEVWEPTADQLAVLTAADTCALLRSIDPGVDDVARSGPHGCKSLPEWDELRVEAADRGTELLYGSPSSFAFHGTELDVAGFTAWEISADEGEGHCAVLVPAGTEGGLLVRAQEGSLCGTLTDRVSSTLRAWQDDPAAFTRPDASPREASLPFTPAGETSLRGSGACADLRDQRARRCAPSEERPVPEDPVELVREGEADPDVVCSAALEAARRAELGAEVRAVTADDDSHRWCVLLVGEREAEVFIRTSREAMGGSTPLTLGGHPARESAFDVPGYEIALGEPDERGHVVVRLATADSALEKPEWGRRLAEELASALLG